MNFIKLGALALFTAGCLSAAVTSAEFIPRETDAKISGTWNEPQRIYVERSIVVDHDPRLPKARDQLLLFLPGTGGSGGGARVFCALGAELGYHVINLTYPTAKYPFGHTHILVTSFPKVTRATVNSDAARPAHTSVIAGGNADRWKEVWTYMLTENVP